MNYFTITFLVLSLYIHPCISYSAAQPQEKTFKVQSMPFDINGLHLQFQYVVKINVYAEQKDYDTGKPEKKVLVLDKKLVDIKRHVVVLNFPMLSDDINPTVKLSDIDKEKYRPDSFDDVNFDGYKDIREPCIPCSGSLGNIETIFLFNHRTKKFEEWQSGLDINIELDPENKTVKSFNGPLYDHGQFHYQEVKFIGDGVELYRKEVHCTFINEKKRTFKIVYNKYMGKKRVAHKTLIRTFEEYNDSLAIINTITDK
jgi:hypothetical protein